MHGMILALALISVSMSAVAQVLFKYGMSAGPMRAASNCAAPPLTPGP